MDEQPPAITELCATGERLYAAEVARLEDLARRNCGESIVRRPTPPTLHFCTLHTDRWGLAHLVLSDRLSALNQRQVLDGLYPGLVTAVERGIAEITERGGSATTIVFLNGKVQVWAADPHHPPSDFYPTQVTPATPGYEAVIDKLHWRAQQNYARAQLVTQPGLTFVTEVRGQVAPREGDKLGSAETLTEAFERMFTEDPRAALKIVRNYAEMRRAAPTGDHNGVIEVMVRRTVVPWGMASLENAKMVCEELGKRRVPVVNARGEYMIESSQLWILGDAFLVPQQLADYE